MIQRTHDEWIDYFAETGRHVLIHRRGEVPRRNQCEDMCRVRPGKRGLDYERQVIRADGARYDYALVTGSASGLDAVWFKNTGDDDVAEYIDEVRSFVPELDEAPTLCTPDGGYIFFVHLASRASLRGLTHMRRRRRPHYTGMILCTDFTPVPGPGSEDESGTYELFSGDFGSIPTVDFFSVENFFAFELVDREHLPYHFIDPTDSVLRDWERMIDLLAPETVQDPPAVVTKFALTLTNQYHASLSLVINHLTMLNNRFVKKLNQIRLIEIAHWARFGTKGRGPSIDSVAVMRYGERKIDRGKKHTDFSRIHALSDAEYYHRMQQAVPKRIAWNGMTRFPDYDDDDREREVDY